MLILGQILEMGKLQVWLCQIITNSAYWCLWTSLINMLELVSLIHAKKLSAKLTIQCFTRGYVSDYFLAVTSNFLESPLVGWQVLRAKE